MHEEQSQEPQDLFGDFANRQEPAGHAKRLANYLIDLVIFSVLLFLLSYVLYDINEGLAHLLYDTDEANPEQALAGNLLTLLLYGMYMGLQEALLKGRSVGKLITGTITVNQDGSRISGQTALLRGLCRAVPFNALSAFGTPPNPWHDRWTKTRVIQVQDLRD